MVRTLTILVIERLSLCLILVVLKSKELRYSIFKKVTEPISYFGRWHHQWQDVSHRWSNQSTPPKKIRKKGDPLVGFFFFAFLKNTFYLKSCISHILKRNKRWICFVKIILQLAWRVAQTNTQSGVKKSHPETVTFRLTVCFSDWMSQGTRRFVWVMVYSFRWHFAHSFGGVEVM